MALDGPHTASHPLVPGALPVGDTVVRAAGSALGWSGGAALQSPPEL